MKSLPSHELKRRATEPGPHRYLAFDELARRTRDDPSAMNASEGPWTWNPLDVTRAPNATEMEWAFLKCSQAWNNGRDPALAQEQEARVDELERHLDEDPDSLEIKYYNALVDELRRQDEAAKAPSPPALGV